jgi:hypothetical protein
MGIMNGETDPQKRRDILKLATPKFKEGWEQAPEFWRKTLRDGYIRAEGYEKAKQLLTTLVPK